jgi:uncharacterized membrane protein YeaQ/YmgE (transglycosylase-associated protein family)
MNWAVFLVLGLVLDLLTHALLPDRGLDAATTLPAVIAGSFAGGVLVNLLSGAELDAVHSTNIVGSLTGALTVLAITIVIGRRVDA